MSKKIFKLSQLVLPLAAATLIATSCNSPSSAPQDDVKVEDFAVNEDIFDDISNAKKIFYSLPSPIETAMLLKSAGAQYDEMLLNPIESADNYTTNQKMALNLGIYTTDLSYASLFEQSQTALNYMNAAKKMADGLGVLDAIDDKTLELIEQNLDNKDKILDIISETFLNSSSQLKEDNRPEIATVVLIGGWVEGLYVATTLVGDGPIENNKLVDRIVDQKLSYEILVKLMDEYPDHVAIKELKGELATLDGIFKEIQINSSKIETSLDESSNITTLNVDNEVVITKDTFDKLSKEVQRLRTNFIL